MTGPTARRLPLLALLGRLDIMLPALLSMFLLLAMGGSLLIEYHRQLSDLERDTESHFRAELVGLSDAAATDLHSNPGEVARRIAYLSTDPRVVTVAILDPATHIVLAHRRTWVGQALADVHPGFRPEQVLPVLITLQPELQWSEDRTRLVFTQGFRARDPGYESRDPGGNPRRLAIYLDVDLKAQRTQRMEEIWRNRWMEMLSMAAGMVALGIWLQRRLVKPILELRHTTQRWASRELGVRVKPAGATEVADLARAGNAMAESLSQAQTEVEASAQRLSTILYSTGEAMLVTDIHQRVTLLNRVGEALTGWTEAQALDRSVDEVFRIENAQTRQPAVSPVARVLAEGVVIGLANHTVLVARNGRRIHIADSAAPIRQGDGSVAGVVIVFRDVSEAYRLEQALAESEHHYRELANSGRALIWTTDPAGNSLWFNESWFVFSGWHRRQAHVNSWRDLILPEDLPLVLEHWRLLCRELHPMSTAARLRRHDGQYRWMVLDGLPRRSPTGELLGFLVQAFDVTEQRDVNDRMQAQLDELRRWHQVTLDREQRVIALKQEVNTLLAAQGQTPRYAQEAPRSEDASS